MYFWYSLLEIFGMYTCSYVEILRRVWLLYFTSLILLKCQSDIVIKYPKNHSMHSIDYELLYLKKKTILFRNILDYVHW